MFLFNPYGCVAKQACAFEVVDEVVDGAAVGFGGLDRLVLNINAFGVACHSGRV